MAIVTIDDYFGKVDSVIDWYSFLRDKSELLLEDAMSAKLPEVSFRPWYSKIPIVGDTLYGFFGGSLACFRLLGVYDTWKKRVSDIAKEERKATAFFRDISSLMLGYYERVSRFGLEFDDIIPYNFRNNFAKGTGITECLEVLGGLSQANSVIFANLDSARKISVENVAVLDKVLAGFSSKMIEDARKKYHTSMYRNPF